MSNEYPTALGAATPDTITLLGADLARDVMAGMDATIGVVSGLDLRRETRRGQQVEGNLVASGMSGGGNQSRAVGGGGGGPLREGETPPRLFP